MGKGKTNRLVCEKIAFSFPVLWFIFPSFFFFLCRNLSIIRSITLAEKRTVTCKKKITGLRAARI